MPNVSVIMPAYNVAPYLAQAAVSVLQQSYGDLELIIVNDGSTDRTGDVAEQVRLSDPQRVRVIEQKNTASSLPASLAMSVVNG